MRNKFQLMLLSMATLGFFSCTDKLTDDITTGGGDIGGETGYISFRIKSADTGGITRATGDAWKDNDAANGDYSTGVEASGSFAHEDAIVNNIQANRVFFFDENGKYHSSSFLSLTKEEGSHGSADEDHPGTGVDNKSTYPEIVYSATVKRTSDRGEVNWPSQCLVVLNGRPSRLNALLARAQAAPEFNMDEFLGWVNEDFRNTDADEEGLTLGLYQSSDGSINGVNDAGNPKYYFTMTNSVFLGSDGKLVDATKIDKVQNLKPTSTEAAANPITVYVERIMSKVEVGFTDYKDANGSTGYFNEENKKGFLYEFTDDHETNSKWFDGKEIKKMMALITNWTINAVEYKTKLFKGIDATNWTTGDNATPFKGWNDPSHHRSYWAIDSHYLWNAEEYPTQYRKSFGGSSSTKSYEDDRVKYPANNNAWSYGEGTAEEDGNDIMTEGYKWALDYKAFNKIINYRRYKYCLENTFECKDDKTGYMQYPYRNMIMGSHLLVQARLLTEGEENEEDLSKITDKYYYSDRYYDEETYINRQVAILNEVLEENVAIGDESAYSIENIKMWKDDTDGTTEKFEFANIAGGLWIKDGEKYKRVVATVEEDRNDSQIAATDVFVIAPAYVDKGDGKVTIALKGDNGLFGYDSQNDS